MGKIKIEFESEYEVGDVVIFEDKKYVLCVGIIEGYYVESNVIWYNIRVNRTTVLTYSNGGDIPEYDILGRVDSTLYNECRKQIIGEED